MTRPGFRRWLALIFGVALVARAAVVLFQWPVPEVHLKPLADSGDYHVIAVSLLEGRGFSNPAGEPTAFRPPVYPLFLAAIYALAGVGNLGAVALVQAFLSAVNTLLAAWVARRAGLSRFAALLSAAGVALYPAFIVQSAQILTEVLARTQLLVAVGLLLEAFRRSRWQWHAAAGAAMALAILNKSALASAAPFVGLVVICWSGTTARERLAHAAAYALPAALLLGAWAGRNAVHSGRFVPVSTNFPITFAQGFTKWSYYTGLWYEDSHELMQAPDNYLQLTQLRAYRGINDELALGDEWMARAKEYCGENKAFVTELSARRALHFWSPFIRNTLAVRIAALLSMGPVLVLGWWMVIRRLRHHDERDVRRYAWLCLAIALPATLPYALSQSDVRYRLALVDPLWIVLAAGLLAEWVEGRGLNPWQTIAANGQKPQPPPVHPHTFSHQL